MPNSLWCFRSRRRRLGRARAGQVHEVGSRGGHGHALAASTHSLRGQGGRAGGRGGSGRRSGCSRRGHGRELQLPAPRTRATRPLTRALGHGRGHGVARLPGRGARAARGRLRKRAGGSARPSRGTDASVARSALTMMLSDPGSVGGSSSSGMGIVSLGGGSEPMRGLGGGREAEMADPCASGRTGRPAPAMGMPLRAPLPIGMGRDLDGFPAMGESARVCGGGGIWKSRFCGVPRAAVPGDCGRAASPEAQGRPRQGCSAAPVWRADSAGAATSAAPKPAAHSVAARRGLGRNHV